MEPSENQSDNSNYDINFLTGINWLLVSDYKEAIHFFLLAVVETDPSDDHYALYQSYAGLSAVIMRQPGGIQHCRHVSDLSYHRHPEVQLNLACAEFFLNNRQLGIQVFDNIDSSALSAGNTEQFHSLFNIVGKRHRDKNGALIREKFIHKFISRLFRKKNVTPREIEAFIRETANKRYKNALNILQSHLKKQLKIQLERGSNEKT